MNPEPSVLFTTCNNQHLGRTVVRSPSRQVFRPDFHDGRHRGASLRYGQREGPRKAILRNLRTEQQNLASRRTRHAVCAGKSARVINHEEQEKVSGGCGACVPQIARAIDAIWADAIRAGGRLEFNVRRRHQREPLGAASTRRMPSHLQHGSRDVQYVIGRGR